MHASLTRYRDDTLSVASTTTEYLRGRKKPYQLLQKLELNLNAKTVNVKSECVKWLRKMDEKTDVELKIGPGNWKLDIHN